MRATLILIGLVVGLYWPTATGAAVPQSFQGLLREADEIRTSDPAQFKRLLIQLDRSAAGATPVQRMHLRLLHAYRLHVMAGDSQGAIRELRAVVAASNDAELQFRAGALLANIYAITRKYPESLEALDRVLALAGQVKNRDSRHQGLLAASIVYGQIGEYTISRRYAERVLAENGNGRSLCLASGLRLDALHNLRAASSDGTYYAAIQRCETAAEPVAVGLGRALLAKKWYAEGKIADAVGLLEKHLPEVEATGYRHLISEFHSLIAQYRLASGDVASAERHATMAVAQNPPGGPGLALVAAYKALYAIADRRGDPVAALGFYKRYAEADKAYLDDAKARELAFQIVRQQTQQKTQQIELLNRQNQVLQLQQRVDRQAAQNTRVIIVLLLALLASIAFWAYKVKRLQLSLRHRAETDALTGICNRQHFALLAERALARCERSGESAALIMFDLDLFKSINDRFGHDAGDWALKRVADTCKTFCRQIDLLGRLGGEEFAILLYGCDLRGAKRIADDCRARIAAIDTRDSGHKFTVTASFGVTDTSISGYDLTKLLSHADLMLYRAKREGRNRVRAFARDMPLQTQLQAVARGDDTQVQDSTFAPGQALGT